MAGQQGVLELGQHRVVEPEDAVHQGQALGDAGRGVAADLLVDRRRLPPRCPELAERGGKVGRGIGRDGRAHGASLGLSARAFDSARPGLTRPMTGAWRAGTGVGVGACIGAAESVGCAAPCPRWKDEQPSEPGALLSTGWPRAPGFRCEGRQGEAGPWEGGGRAREHDTPGSQARAGRAGRGAGRARRPDAAARRLVAQPRGHRGVPDRRRRLRHLGRVPELPLLRGSRRAPRPDLAAVLPLHHRQLRAASRGAGPSRGGGSRPASWPSPFPVGSGPPATTTARPTTGASGSRPPGCAVSDGHARYTGETRFPLILQNLHRYFFVVALVFNVILTIDAVMAFRLPGDGGIGVSVGTLVLVANATLLWLYSASCHACRHLCGGSVNEFSKHPIRYRLWKLTTPLNARHMQIAWASLAMVAFADLYVRLVASGVFTTRRSSEPGSCLTSPAPSTRPTTTTSSSSAPAVPACGPPSRPASWDSARPWCASRCSARPTPSWPKAARRRPWATCGPRTTGRCTSATPCAAARCSTTGAWPSCTPRRHPTASTSSSGGGRCSTGPRTAASSSGTSAATATPAWPMSATAPAWS